MNDAGGYLYALGRQGIAFPECWGFHMNGGHANHWFPDLQVPGLIVNNLTYRVPLDHSGEVTPSTYLLEVSCRGQQASKKAQWFTTTGAWRDRDLCPGTGFSYPCEQERHPIPSVPSRYVRGMGSALCFTNQPLLTGNIARPQHQPCRR
jgi:hypothetical protein